MHDLGGHPHLTVAQNPPKRKGSEGASRVPSATREERKRACNERGSESGGTSHPTPEAVSTDIVGPITLMAPDKMASNVRSLMHAHDSHTRRAHFQPTFAPPYLFIYMRC